MKKIVLFFAAFCVAGSALAQVNPADLTKKMAASDAAIANASQASKAKTWQTRGDVYLEVGQDVSKYLLPGMSVSTLRNSLRLNNPESTRQEEHRGVQYKVLTYPGVDIYATPGDTVIFWNVTRELYKDPIGESLAAYRKAIELDPKMENRVKSNMTLALDQYRQNADFAYRQNDLLRAADYFAKIYNNSLPPVFAPDTLAAFNAATLYVNQEDYDNAIKYYLECKKLGYEEDGELYFNLYYCYNAQDDKDKAAAILEEGVQKYPENSKLLESLIIVYTASGKDPGDIIKLTEAAIANDPNNATNYNTMGLIYKNLGDNEKAEAALLKAAEMDPNNASAALNLADLYLNLAEKARVEWNEIPYNEKARQDAKLAERNDYYRKALPLLEKVQTLVPDLPPVVERLRYIYFNFRDEGPEMEQNYKKYYDLFQTLPQE
jgi:tetratricopeptide (TPR) repeat protein